MLKNFPNLLKRHPWGISYVNIGQRCSNPNHPKFKFYGGKGIAREVSSSELKRMYLRDKAYLMKSPSVDRADARQNYSFKNCKYIEMEENRREANDRRTARILVSKLFNKNIDIDKLQNRVLKMNCPSEMSVVEETDRFVSPPFKGERRLRNQVPKQYPKQLSGLHDAKKQRHVVSGSSRGGEGSFGGVTGSYGVPTGGSYRT